MDFHELIQFVEHDKRMSHVYQPVMLRELLNRNGRATVAEIARALLNEDPQSNRILLGDYKEHGRACADKAERR
jgi:hypothetical protein